jgi:hypothetical protein
MIPTECMSVTHIRQADQRHFDGAHLSLAAVDCTFRSVPSFAHEKAFASRSTVARWINVG